MATYTCDDCGTEHTLERDASELGQPQLYLVNNLNQDGCDNCPANIEADWFDATT